jgi:CBS domain-containing protein
VIGQFAALAGLSKLLHHYRQDQTMRCVPARGLGCAGNENKSLQFKHSSCFLRRRHMTVKSILNTKGRQISYVDPDTKLMAAVTMLSQRRIGAVLVMKDQKLLGILSERDIVRVLGERGADVLNEAVSQVMTRKVVTCRETDTVSFIMETMTAGKFRHLPVLEGDKVVGLISIGDVVKVRVKEYEHEQQALQEYIKTA